MLKEAVILYQEVNKLIELLPLLERMKRYCNEHYTALGNLADTAFMCRESENIIELFTKELHKLSSIAQENASVCMEALGQDIIRTDFCSASPNPRIWYKIPYSREKGPQWFDQVMKSIGVSELAFTKELVRLHPPAFVDYCGELVGNGGVPPEGIDPKNMTGVELKLRITKKRSSKVDENPKTNNV